MKKNNKGFSLVELIGVIVLISLATIIIAPNMIKIMQKNEQDSFEESVKGLIRSVQNYYASTLDNFPEEGLQIADIDFEVDNKDKFISGTIANDNGTYIVENLTDGKFCANGKRNSLEITNGC